MKTRFQSRPIVIAAVMMLSGQLTPPLLAQAPASTTQPAPVQLSAGVWDVLRMAHGNVSDATIIAYVKNSGRAYPLGASEVVYLREQGVADQVITAMLEQPKTMTTNVALSTAAQPAQAAQPVQPAQPAPSAVWASDSNTTAPQVVAAPAQPAPTYVQAAPVYAQPSPVYVYPSYSYYDYWPSYGYWGYPAVSFSFGWGGRYGGYRGWGYRGGYYGGGHWGGGYRGGGGHHR